jgi:hypothetical protein
MIASGESTPEMRRLEMDTVEKVTVDRRALVQRINRALARRGQKMMTARGQRARTEVGRFSVLDVRRNGIVSKHVDLARLAQELKALRPYEQLEDNTNA